MMLGTGSSSPSSWPWRSGRLVGGQRASCCGVDRAQEFGIPPGAKCLNSQQARWALFFTGFNLTVIYTPGSWNTKADALSRQFAPYLDNEEKEMPILPPSCVVGTLTWKIEKIIRDAQQQELDPRTGLEGKVFVPASAQYKVIHWAHMFTCHPGKNRTIAFLHCCFGGLLFFRTSRSMLRAALCVPE